MTPRNGSRTSRRSSEDTEPIEGIHDPVDEGRHLYREPVSTEVFPEGVEPVFEHRRRLREADPWRCPRAVHPQGLGEFNEERMSVVDEDVERTEIRVDHPARAMVSIPARISWSRGSGSSNRTSTSRGAGPSSSPRYRIENMASTRRAGVGTRTPPFHARCIASNSSAARQPIASAFTGPSPLWEVRYRRYIFTAIGAPLYPHRRTSASLPALIGRTTSVAS